MFYVAAQPSGIDDALLEWSTYVGPWYLLPVLFVATVVVSTVLLNRAVDGEGEYIKRRMIAGCTIVILGAGSLLWTILSIMNTQEHLNENLREAALENIEENIAVDAKITSSSISESDYVVTVRGTTSEQRHITFDMVYDEELDTMLPLEELNNPVDLPIKEGSVVAEVLDA